MQSHCCDDAKNLCKTSKWNYHKLPQGGQNGEDKSIASGKGCVKCCVQSNVTEETKRILSFSLYLYLHLYLSLSLRIM